jgi:hypothetical protein
MKDVRHFEMSLEYTDNYNQFLDELSKIANRMKQVDFRAHITIDDDVFVFRTHVELRTFIQGVELGWTIPNIAMTS